GAAAAQSTTRLDEAVDAFRRCLALAPSDDAAANDLAWTLSRRRTTAPEGLSIARTLTARGPCVARFWDTRAACAAAAGDDEDADSSWRRALALHAAAPSLDPDARAATALRLATWLAANRRPSEARDVARAALQYAKGAPTERALRELLD